MSTEHEQLEQAYQSGNRAAWHYLLIQCLKQLDYTNQDAVALIVEREAAIATLRRLCSEYGDNEWPTELHLSDIIEKHLIRQMLNRQP